MKPKQCNTVNILFWWLREEREEEALGLMLMLRGKTITVFQEPVCFDELRKRVYNSRVPVNNDMRGSPRCAVIPSSQYFSRTDSEISSMRGRPNTERRCVWRLKKEAELG